jgi:nucleoside-diphosphate-sugar epimerase
MERGRVGERDIIAGPAHTLVEAFAIAQRVTGIPAPRAIPPAFLRAGAWLLDRVGRDGESLRVMAGATYLGDNAKARRELGFAPRTIDSGLEETLRYEMKALGVAGSPARKAP